MVPTEGVEAKLPILPLGGNNHFVAVVTGDSAFSAEMPGEAIRARKRTKTCSKCNNSVTTFSGGEGGLAVNRRGPRVPRCIGAQRFLAKGVVRNHGDSLRYHASTVSEHAVWTRANETESGARDEIHWGRTSRKPGSAHAELNLDSSPPKSLPSGGWNMDVGLPKAVYHPTYFEG